MNICVRGTNWVGDAVMSIPALRELRRVFPAARITLHTRSWARGIFEDAGYIDEITTFDKSGSKLNDALAQAQILRQGNFELAVLLTNSFESALICKLAKIPRRFGYAKEARSFLLTDAVQMPEWKDERHEVYYYLNLVGTVEKAMRGTQTTAQNVPAVEINVSAERRTKARRILRDLNVDLSKKTIALGVGSTNSRAKRWQAESYAKLNDLLQNDLNVNVILVGAPDEREVAAEVFDKSTVKPVILTGKTSLSEAVAVLSEVDLLVANDMGLAHVAPAAGTPAIVIFGPTNERATQPLGSEIIRKDVDCAPCMLRDCPIDHRCMTRISPAEVYEKIREKLTENE